MTRRLRIHLWLLARTCERNAHTFSAGLMIGLIAGAFWSI